MAQLRTALVTGAARGIGRATVDAMLAAGLRVIALDRDFEGGALVASGPLELVRQDLADLAAIAPRVAALGRIDVLINNAGVQNGLPIERYTDEARTRLLRINLEAPVELIRAVSKQMIERRSGRIDLDLGRGLHASPGPLVRREQGRYRQLHPPALPRFSALTEYR